MKKRENHHMSYGFGERLRAVRGESTIATFAERFGIHKNTMSRYERGATLPDGGFLADICRSHFISPDWLLTGRGPMRAEVSQDAVGGEGYAYMSLYDLSDLTPDGTPGEVGGLREVFVFRSGWFTERLGGEAREFILLSLPGESMEPTLAKEDMALVRVKGGERHTDGIYLIVTDKTLQIKRLQFTSGEVVAISDNPIYEDFRLGEGNITGRVAWAGKYF